MIGAITCLRLNDMCNGKIGFDLGNKFTTHHVCVVHAQIKAFPGGAFPYYHLE